jgi:hypothetical protein
MGYEGAVPAGQIVKTGGNLDYYVAGDAAAASDSNPGTIALPWKTIDHAIDVLNIFDEITGLFTVHIAPAPVATYSLTKTIKSHLLRDNVVFYADGAGQGGDGFTVLQGSTVAQAGSSNVQVVTPAGLGVNTFRGKTIQVLTGAAAGDLRTIRDHTDTVIIPSRNFTAAIAANDTIRILEPATVVKILITTNENAALDIGIGDSGISYFGNPSPAVPPMLIFANIQFAGQTALVNWMFSGCVVGFFGCEAFGPTATSQLPIGGAGATIICGCQWPAGTCVAPLATTYNGALSNTSWSGWGLYGKTGLQVATVTLGGFIVTGITTNVQVLVFIGSVLLWVGGSSAITNGVTPLQFGLGAKTAQAILGSLAAIAPPVALTNTAGTNAALDVNSGGNTMTSLEMYLRRVLLTAPVLVRATGAVKLTVGSSANASGAGTTLGMDIRSGAAAYLEGVTGLLGPAGADLSVDGGTTTIAAATLGAAQQALINGLNGSLIVRIT